MLVCGPTHEPDPAGVEIHRVETAREMLAACEAALPADIAVCAAAVAAPAMAHHSFAMFDNEKTVDMKGTVKEFEWTNPHAWLYLVATNEAGKPEEWAFEMASPLQLTSKGWKQDSLKAGDKITSTLEGLGTLAFTLS